MLLGYARVSTGDQNPDHQIDALTRAGVDPEHIHLDRASGAKASRPGLDALVGKLRDGDTVVITRLDRLGRSVVHLVTLGAQLQHLRERVDGTSVQPGRGRVDEAFRFKEDEHNFDLGGDYEMGLGKGRLKLWQEDGPVREVVRSLVGAARAA